MSYQIKKIRFFVRETAPARFASALGKKGQAKTAKRVTSPLCHVHMTLKDDSGSEVFGCSADRLSVRWLDKREGRTKGRKLRELASLIEYAAEVYLDGRKIETPFEKWRSCHKRIMAEGRRRNQEDLTSTFASALVERAMLDGVCRLAKRPFFVMAKADGLGIDAGAVHPELAGRSVSAALPELPVTTIGIRHTVGIYDPLTDEDWPAEQRLDDGLPETVQDYIRKQGIRYFKVKISGDAESDLRRLARLWEILPLERAPAVTLDANEAFEDLEQFARFVARLEKEQLGLFQHILFIEQPLPRRLALHDKAERWIRRIGKSKPVIIDESDETVGALRRAHKLGYSGTSHKNCKGVFKSLLNRMLVAYFAEEGDLTLMSGEDLQNLPIVPLQQDFVTVGTLGLSHCERNGHHYNFGLSMLSEKDKASAAKHHQDLYERRGDELFLRIRDGAVRCDSLHGVGFGVRDEPDWPSMEPLSHWIKRRYPVNT